MANDKIRNFLSSVSDNFRIVKEKIHPDVFSEFIDYEKNLANKSSIDPESIQKKEFTELAADGSIEAFRQIERILSESELSKEVRQFGLVALNFCRFKIENDLLDEPVDMISGGLGGTENKMRYFLALVGHTAITPFQFDFLKDAFDKVTKDRDSILEEAQNFNKYVTLLILGSYDYAIGEIIDAGIDECEFLEKEYYLTNVEIPTSEQILKWMNDV
jgi:hypothetical protein